jgi:hypothetical protein
MQGVAHQGLEALSLSNQVNDNANNKSLPRIPQMPRHPLHYRQIFAFELCSGKAQR